MVFPALITNSKGMGQMFMEKMHMKCVNEARGLDKAGHVREGDSGGWRRLILHSIHFHSPAAAIFASCI